MSTASDFVRLCAAMALPRAILSRGPSLQGTKFLASETFKAWFGAGRPFQMVNVGACDGKLFDDVTPWLHTIAGSKALLVEPIPYNQARLRENYPDTYRFIIEPVAVTANGGPITVKTFDAQALESGKLPIEFIGCSSITQNNLMSGKNAWGEDDPNFAQFAPFLKEIEVQGEPLQTLLDRNKIAYIDAFLVDCEGADWDVFKQLDLARYRPGMIKIEVGALCAADIGHVLLKLKTCGYHTGLYGEDIWGFA